MEVSPGSGSDGNGGGRTLGNQEGTKTREFAKKVQTTKALSLGLSELPLNPKSTPTPPPVVPGQVGRCCLWELGTSKYKNSPTLLVNVKGPETL